MNDRSFDEAGSTAEAVAAPSPGACEQVGFSRACRRKPRSGKPEVPVIHGLANLVVLLCLIALQGSVLLGLGPIPGAVAAGLLLAGILAWSVVHIRRRRRIFDAADLDVADDTVRLLCIGSRAYLERHGPLADLAFEPAIFRSLFVQRSMKYQVVVFVLLLIPAYAAVHYFLAWFMGKPQWSWQLVLKIWLAIGVVLWFTGWMWPTYFRVVPGRLDVMRFSNLRGRPIAVSRYDLRRSRITVDLRRSILFIDGEDGQADFTFLLMRERDRFGYYILLGALSTHQPPPLPEDALLG
ncbi:MAG: hypothetical protein JSU68_01820 [Phycisphaerales bacterium]|nr:MAG: hypothetical protein JSU68_01820 [Phycisphaerales bacterium]